MFLSLLHKHCGEGGLPNVIVQIAWRSQQSQIHLHLVTPEVNWTQIASPVTILWNLNFKFFFFFWRRIFVSFFIWIHWLIPPNPGVGSLRREREAHLQVRLLVIISWVSSSPTLPPAPASKLKNKLALWKPGLWLLPRLNSEESEMVLDWIQILSLAYLPPTVRMFVRFREQSVLAQAFLIWVCRSLKIAWEHLCTPYSSFSFSYQMLWPFSKTGKPSIPED